MKIKDVNVDDRICQLGSKPFKVVCKDMVGKLSPGPCIILEGGIVLTERDLAVSGWQFADNRDKKTDHQKRVEQFMRLAGQDVLTSPCLPTTAVRLLRAKLIFEEAMETINALGFEVYAIDGMHQVLVDEISIIPSQCGPDLIEIADGCADISVVTIGTLSACGIADRPLLEEVDDSNLQKFGPGSHRREDGKWIKPAGWVPPKIGKVLGEQKPRSGN
jgi:predicted HAD superfamily Cof-like phosphohydrolase